MNKGIGEDHFTLVEIVESLLQLLEKWYEIGRPCCNRVDRRLHERLFGQS